MVVTVLTRAVLHRVSAGGQARLDYFRKVVQRPNTSKTDLEMDFSAWVPCSAFPCRGLSSRQAKVERAVARPVAGHPGSLFTHTPACQAES